MIRPAVFLALLAVAAPAPARERMAHVPFVGCPADGQTGPVPAPKSATTPIVPSRAAAKLAYYVSEGMAGILAPRGWHCIQLYGSSGAFMLVTPERHRAKEFFSDKIIPIHGPAIQRSVSYGGTSGRFQVAEQIARYFPSRMKFARHVIDLDGDVLKDVPPRTKRYKSDWVTRRSVDRVDFITPAGKEGEGTNSRLLPSSFPIEGFRKIIGPTSEPDLVGVEVRLPPNLRFLTPLILADAAQ